METTKTNGQTLESLDVGPLPVVNRFLQRLKLQEIFAQHLPRSDARRKLVPGLALEVFVRNMLLSRHPLYELPEWAGRFVPELLGLEPGDMALLNDDRIGRCLDLLFQADRAKLVTAFTLRVIEGFGLELDVLHNDSTTITFSGRYRSPADRRGQRLLRITHGHNKDHRPDLRQLLFEMTVTEDGAVPVLVGLHDGNVTDDQTHLSTWKILRGIVGRPDFVYVADCKLCVTRTLTYITGQGGHFVTVLPATRKEEGWFKEWIQTHVVPWEEVWRRPPLRRKTDPPDIFLGCESPLRSAEGYRILWYHSSVKHEFDQEARQSRIRRAAAELEFLKTRVGARKLKTLQEVQGAVGKILQETDTLRWVEVEVQPGERTEYRQAGPGRPGKLTQYVQDPKPHPQITWRMKDDTIAWDAKLDGLFPLITDMKKASLQQVLLWYKFQPKLEKRFEQLKTVMEVRPVSLKSVARVEAYLLLYYIALTIGALIEREIRRAMKAEGIAMLPLYPEQRACKAPTAERVLELFGGLRRHRLSESGLEVNRFNDELSPLQRKVLRLLDVPMSPYAT
jgi:transposase